MAESISEEDAGVSTSACDMKLDGGDVTGRIVYQNREINDRNVLKSRLSAENASKH